jgi:putative transposase
MPEQVHVRVWPRQPGYEIGLIRTALKVPVPRAALAFLRRHAPTWLKKPGDEQPNGYAQYRFWQRGDAYDRNVRERRTLLSMIDSMHNNPVRRGLFGQARDWQWSSARFYVGQEEVDLKMDAVGEFIG